MGAVGGFYASSLLQGRMDCSVLQSLSRFRNLSAAMAEFLANATQEIATPSPPGLPIKIMQIIGVMDDIAFQTCSGRNGQAWRGHCLRGSQ
ncbi:hypothetical protein VCM43_23210 [Rhizobium sp. MJ21]|nr:hypothetical protein [Rhizobium sp. MJ21]